MSKNKIQLQEGMDVDGILKEIETKYAHENPNAIDGVKIDFANQWVHLRKSNTEPIIRVYSEAPTAIEADELAKRFIVELEEIAAR
jgi:phosphomannomutase